jgi:hypothetical protein
MSRSDFYVYVLFRENGVPFYVGKGQKSRWLDHEAGARRGERGHRFSIIRKMQARGAEVPKVKLHEGLTEIVAHEYEVALITAIGRHPRGPLVNLTNGGEGVSDPAPEVRAKLAAAASSRERSREERAKISAALIGKRLSAERIASQNAGKLGKKRSLLARQHMSKAQHGRIITPEARAKLRAINLGKRHSQDTRAKMSAAQRGIPKSIQHRAKQAAGMRAAWARRANLAHRPLQVQA